MNLSELRDLIRAEASIGGFEEYTNLIDFQVNQELQRFTGKSKYEELRTSTTFTVSTAESHLFALPDDYQLFDSLLFTPANVSLPFGPVTLSRGIVGRFSLNSSGAPLYWARYGAQLQVYPYTDVAINDTLFLSYYKKVTLTLDTDEFPVPSLEKAVQQAVMARLVRMKDSRKAQQFKAEAQEAYLDSRAQNAGN